jgi:hypothetical protein
MTHARNTNPVASKIVNSFMGPAMRPGVQSRVHFGPRMASGIVMSATSAGGDFFPFNELDLKSGKTLRDSAIP